ncbi:hypothetical protein DFQ01_13552 [Paenibacillus cellulosilyticus]|uniref:Colicin import membrane protein n=1 Tax=Paenibacillus cellulosilyticus TaxID=375489 RepID=A0A2V2YH67_9BACL|nr:hypothetical protein [Paenibacillus cellulosilyticus]PWV92491.1 hypothetical protein DFQ01_13552 [Paenibacillus cellulosilyticus]QKS47061.1 hypothetical protein HUB94_21615 [Paenibacillus cellulosilyticus]
MLASNRTAGRRLTAPVILLLAMLCSLLPAPSAHAAAQTLSATAQKQFDKMKAAATAADSAKLQSLYNTYVQVQAQNNARDTKLKATSKQNDTDETALRSRIKAIDQAKIEQLERKLKQTKEGYQPLFDKYAATAASLKAAKQLGSKTLIAAMQLQVDLLEISVKAAKADIKNVDAAWKQAKADATATIKRLRDQLAAIDKEEKLITPQKSAITQLNKQKSSEWSDFLYALRTGDSKNAIRSLTSLGSVLNETAQRLATIEACEARIAAIIKSVSSQVR